MQLRFIIELAFKNLVSRRLRTVLTLAGVGIAISFAVFLLSIGYGLQIISLDEIVNAEAVRTIDVSPAKGETGVITNDDVKVLKSLITVQAVYPQISLGGTLNYGGSSIDSVIYGKAAGLVKLDGAATVAGKLYGSSSDKEAIINTTALDQLGADKPADVIGKTISVKPAGDSAAAAGVSEPIEYKIVGVIEGKKAPYIYVPLTSLEKEGFRTYDRAKVMADSQDDVSALQAAIQDLGYQTSSARETVEQANALFDVFKVLLLFFGSIAVIVAFVGMFNTLTISLLEKTREVGMMRALGATHRDVQRLFLTEALIIGILGGVSGVVLALLTGLAVNGGVAILAGVTGNEPATIFYSPTLLVIAMFVIAAVSSFLTGLYPARRAAKTKILDALRYE